MDNVRPLNEKSPSSPNTEEEILPGQVKTAEETDPDPGDGIKLGLPVEVEG